MDYSNFRRHAVVPMPHGKHFSFTLETHATHGERVIRTRMHDRTKDVIGTEKSHYADKIIFADKYCKMYLLFFNASTECFTVYSTDFRLVEHIYADLDPERYNAIHAGNIPERRPTTVLCDESQHLQPQPQ